ncbi:MAG: type 2 isopentenyl-diphosphate Delta-isomerase [Desulfurococcales archaeon]|nr:type 2 isopentenyl-diphosphate Delta-isomerase [Desulfurococcales archaeon]
MSEPGQTISRKLEHIRMVLEAGVESAESTLLDNVRIVHNPIPELDLDDVDTSIDFCGGKRRLRAPLMITGMTGGHPDVTLINKYLAEAAARHGIAFGVGSQRAALEDPRVVESYRVAVEARKKYGDLVIVANLGAPQYARAMGGGRYGLRQAIEAVDMVEADALAIHLNPGQEAYQDEGDPYYAGFLEALQEIIDGVSVPVIIKETGTGLSMEAVRTLRRMGVKCFDVSGLGGTNWIKVEVLRSKKKHGAPLKPAGPLADYWGNPTAVAIVEARLAAPDAYIIASGGVRNGLDVAKSIALGADIAGVALPALRALLAGMIGDTGISSEIADRGLARLDRLLASMIYQVKTALFMTGSRRPRDLWTARISVYGRLREELETAGVDVYDYIYRGRVNGLLWRNRL